MASHKKIIIRLILLTLIISLFCSFEINSVIAQTTIGYTFERNDLIDWSNPTPDFSRNVRNQTYFTGTYNGTYTFTNEADESSPSGWIPNEAGGYVNISGNLDCHDKVYTFNDRSGAGVVESEQIGGVDFNEVSGTIEYWFYMTDATSTIYFILVGITDWRFYIYTLNDLFYINDGSGVNTGVSCNDNTWYHIRIDFEHGAGSYLGLAPDTWNLWINSVYVNTYDFGIAGATADRIFITTSTPNSGFYASYDAFGYSWDTNYNIGDNIVPFGYPNNTQEVDRYTFFNNENGTITENNQQDIPYWNELLTGGLIKKSIIGLFTTSVVYFYVHHTNNDGIERSIDVSNGIVRQINFTVGWIYAGSKKTYINFDIDSFDDTLICRLRIDDDASLGDLKLSYYYDGSYVELQDLTDDTDVLKLNITIVGNIVVCDTSDGTYIFPVITPYKEGLGDIKIECYSTEIAFPNMNFYIDSIGIYIDGSSVSNDFSNHYYAVSPDFNNKYYNLFEINATGYFGLAMSNLYSNIFTFFSYQNVSSLSFSNYLGESQQAVIPSYISVITNTTFNINSLKIYGVKLNDGSNDFIPTITYANINHTESYFYVDTSNRLRFSLIVNDNNSEFIQASFNILNVLSENRSVSFLSNIDGTSLGFFRMMYTDDTSSFIPFPTWMSTSNVILPQTKDIDNLAILITDNDNNDNDYCYGYVSNVQLIYLTGSLTTITTLNLMMVIVPIIVLLVPTFGIASKYGKSVILPIFILMSIICFITQLIPVWLFFVIMFGASAFLFMKYKGGIE